MHATPSLVGRARELRLLHASLPAVGAARGGVAFIVGEPGIGKTALARAFADDAREAGARVLWGACLEGDWQPPYGPWAEALGGHAATLDGEQLVREIGDGGTVLARFLPAVRAAIPDLPPAADLRPEEERARLFDAIAQWLLALARQSPVVLVLDDLHWADRDSLWLLRQVARTAVRAPVLIVGTYRDIASDFDRQRALIDVLAVLHREVDAQRLALSGFDQGEVAAYLADMAGHAVAGGLAETVHAETGGNPFYLREICRDLAATGARARAERDPPSLSVPGGARQGIARRMAPLTDATRAMLELAAACFGGVTLHLLGPLTGLDDDPLLDSLDEAIQAGLLRISQPGPPATYDFVHAIVRHALYDALNPDRRARLHRRIAASLAQAADGHESAAEIAAQYHASRAIPGGEHGLPYALAAAEAAHDGYAHERAAHYLRLARDLAPDPASRATILRRLALAEADALLLAEARQSAEEAVALGTGSQDPRDLAAFLGGVARGLKDGGADRSLWEPLVRQGLSLAGERRDLTWARLALLLDRVEPLTAGVVTVARWIGPDPEAIVIARREGSEDDYARTLEPGAWRSRRETLDLLALTDTWQRPAAVLRALDVIARDLLFRHGDTREAEAVVLRLLALARRYGSVVGQVEALFNLAIARMFFGNRALAEEHLAQSRSLTARLGTMHRLHFAPVAVESMLAYFFEGDWAALAASTRRFGDAPLARQGSVGFASAALGAMNVLRAGDESAARRLLAGLAQVHAAIEPTDYMYSSTFDRACSVIWELAATEYAEQYHRLAHALIARNDSRGMVNAYERDVALMAALLGHHEESSDYFARARVTLDAAGHRTMRAIVDYDEALALTRANSPDHARIAALLDAALDQFTALGMVGWEARARALRAEQENRGAGEQANHAPTPPRPHAHTSHVLTPREAEVLRLVASGRTNKEIADELFLSVTTVQRHLANIYTKIDARGRADATAYALQHGITPLPRPLADE
ncbi:MAG: AAA family ATPase [Thermomicrobiales bacterium]